MYFHAVLLQSLAVRVLSCMQRVCGYTRHCELLHTLTCKPQTMGECMLLQNHRLPLSHQKNTLFEQNIIHLCRNAYSKGEKNFNKNIRSHSPNHQTKSSVFFDHFPEVNVQSRCNDVARFFLSPLRLKPISSKAPSKCSACYTLSSFGAVRAPLGGQLKMIWPPNICFCLQCPKTTQITIDL